MQSAPGAGGCGLRLHGCVLTRGGQHLCSWPLPMSYRVSTVLCRVLSGNCDKYSILCIYYNSIIMYHLKSGSLSRLLIDTISLKLIGITS